LIIVVCLTINVLYYCKHTSYSHGNACYNAQGTTHNEIKKQLHPILKANINTLLWSRCYTAIARIQLLTLGGRVLGVGQSRACSVYWFACQHKDPWWLCLWPHSCLHCVCDRAEWEDRWR